MMHDVRNGCRLRASDASKSRMWADGLFNAEDSRPNACLPQVCVISGSSPVMMNKQSIIVHLGELKAYGLLMTG
jgi:hypothetical protein